MDNSSTPQKDSEHIINSRYEIRKKLGEGGTGCTYLVWDRRLGRNWVMKEVNCTDEAMKASVKRELNALLRIRHTGIPVLTDMFSEDNKYCIIMEYMKGTSIREYISAKGPMSQQEAIGCCLSLCSLVDFLHQLSPPVIHGDLKPENLLYGREGISLLDFGASVCYGRSSDMITGFFSPGFSAPELMNGDPLSIACDIYSIGALLFYLVTGQDPTDVRGIYPVREWDPELSIDIEECILRCTRSLPHRRSSSVREIISWLETASKNNEGEAVSRPLPLRYLLGGNPSHGLYRTIKSVLLTNGHPI